MTREFPDKPGAVDLGDPATDLPLTLRVYPDDDPLDPGARRVVKVGQDDSPPWLRITGGRSGMGYDNAEVADWPYTSTVVAGAAFLPADPHHGLDVDYDSPLGPWAHCSCGESTSVDRKYDAAEWHREHRRQARNTTAQAAERGDMDVAAFKGATPTAP